MSTVAAPKKSKLAKSRPLTDAEALQLVLRAIADPQRFTILRTMAANNCGADVNCVALLEAVGVSQPTLSHHMKELRSAGLVVQKREGRSVRYHLHLKILEAFINQLRDELLPDQP